MAAPASGSPGGRAPDAGELELLQEARRAAANAYAPYSGFAVGAVAAAPDGRRFAGVNVENASYPVGQCAERVALGALAASGGRRVAQVAVAAASGVDLLPCGACLQALAEFGEPVVVALLAGRPRAFELRQLLPVPFAGESISAAAGGPTVRPNAPPGEPQ
jgi:cytidine deaminase